MKLHVSILATAIAICICFSAPTSASVVVEGTVENLLPGGFVDIRDAATCVVRRFATDYHDGAIYDRLYRFEAENRAIGVPLNVVVEISPTLKDAVGYFEITRLTRGSSIVNETKRCVVSLGFRHAEGTMTPISSGMQGGAFDLRLRDGKVLAFHWLYRKSTISMDEVNAFRCFPVDNCTLSHPRVRVTYKIEQDEGETNLIPVQIERI